MSGLEDRLREIAADTAGTFAFYVHDLASGERALVRAGEEFPAASVIKLPVMLRLFEMAAAGEVALLAPLRMSAWHAVGGSGIFQHFLPGLTVPLLDAITAMIASSDNTATNMCLDVSGLAPVTAMLDRLGCPRTRLGRYLGKPDLSGAANVAVPAEIGRLLELVLGRAMLTPALCDLAITVLRRQTHRALLPRLLPEGTPAAHKTGSLNGVRHDAGIFWRPAGSAGGSDGATAPAHRDPMRRAEAGGPTGAPVVFVAMSRDVADLRWTVDNAAEVTIARAARAAYDHFAGAAATGGAAGTGGAPTTGVA